MTKADLIQKVYSSHKDEASKKLVTEMIETLFDNLGAAIKRDGRFAMPGFGTFSVRRRKARTGRNPQTGASIRIPASKTVGFKPAPTLKGRL